MNPKKAKINQLLRFADSKYFIGLPSKIDEARINIGPEKTQSQVINAKAPIFLLSGFAMTAPRDQVKAPDKTKKIPTY